MIKDNTLKKTHFSVVNNNNIITDYKNKIFK